jgi:hypothetical protein
LPETVRTGFVEKKRHQGFFLGKGKRRKKLEKATRRQGDKAGQTGLIRADNGGAGVGVGVGVGFSLGQFGRL